MRRTPGRRLNLATATVTATFAVLAGGWLATAPSGHAPRIPVASRPVGSSAVGWSGLADRSWGPSRDSERQALADAARAVVPSGVTQGGRQAAGDLAKLAHSAQIQANRLARIRYVLPVDHFVLTARFGMTGTLWSSFHTGLDFACPSGTPIHAVATGTIISTGWAGPYGNLTQERLPDGTVLYYAHQSRIEVHPGQPVRVGQVIGLVGQTGNATGPHVHLEVRPGGGDPVDPYAWLVFHGLHP